MKIYPRTRAPTLFLVIGTILENHRTRNIKMDSQSEKELAAERFETSNYNGKGCFRHYNCQHHHACYQCGGKPLRIESTRRHRVLGIP